MKPKITTRRFREIEVSAHCECGHALGSWRYLDSREYGHACFECGREYPWRGDDYTSHVIVPPPTYPYTMRIYEHEMRVS